MVRTWSLSVALSLVEKEKSMAFIVAIDVYSCNRYLMVGLYQKRVMFALNDVLV